MKKAYFHRFEHETPPVFAPMSKAQQGLWHFLAGMSVAAGLWYLNWRWTASLNAEAMLFSVSVAIAETLFFLGTLLFFFDVWREEDTQERPVPDTRAAAGLDQEPGEITVDVFFTTFDEAPEIVAPSLEAANQLRVPNNVQLRVFVLDDGNRPVMRDLARQFSVNYITRLNNHGFKAGNLRNALFQTDGDFVVICDADTRLFPSFLENTLGYFHDPKVAWVQTPHWFYDIPPGEPWDTWLARNGVGFRRIFSAALQWATGAKTVGRDPFMSNPALFFDVIQRRRNRHGAAFCCGAASIHRREAIFESAMTRKAVDLSELERRFYVENTADILPCVTLEPFRFHVSEDIYTSILLHGDTAAGWVSVYHPRVEAKMLSPWSMKAWATQRLKYAGGTFDIMFRDNPLFKRGMPWATKLHYAATFGAYLNVLWAPILLFAPAFALTFGVSPVSAYSVDFFVHFLPAVILTELAVWAGMKGHDIGQGRTVALATLPLNVRALVLVLLGRRPQFPTTPKKPGVTDRWRYVRAHIGMLVIMGAGGAAGVFQTLTGGAGHSASMLTVNLFWLCWNMTMIGRMVLAAAWRPEPQLNSSTNPNLGGVHATFETKV